jgi:N-acetylglutamate synthase-like GNAT family acetyltransferase
MTTPTDLSILDYTDAHARAFYDINAQWIETMFALEDHDRHVLSHPRETILDPGGAILMVTSQAHGIVGVCALMKTGEGTFELTKMGVLENIRGLKAGEFLLRAVLERAAKMDIASLYLLTSSKCEAAIHLYEKVGFVHDVGIMRRYGDTYARCDVAMSYPIARI